MRISEVIPGHHETVRRVGIKFPQRLHAVKAAVHLYKEHGIDTDVDTEGDTTIVWIEAPRHLAPYVMGLLEAATGVRGFNDWDPTTDYDYGTLTD